MNANALRRLLFVIFCLSGFSGLIYESIWSHYLKHFLGHAAYAQTLVLTIFMGGMAIGSWLAAKYGTKWKHLLLAYALAEGLIGLMGLLFHSVFADFTELAHSSLIPGIGVPWLVNTFKWTASALLILPQSILLGMTFPLMSVGIIRLFPEKPGTTLGILYFSNSIGAAVGVLVGGFVFIEWVGLPGTIRIAGLLNIILALMVWFGVVSRARTDSTSNQSITAVEKTTHKSTASDAGFGEHGFVLLLLISLFTGMASFIYEIGWIRMLSLVLGSSTHAFELMLSAFILGLALGGYAIRRYIDNRRNLLAKLGVIQLVMGLFALSTILLYNHSFDWMVWLLTALTVTEPGYVLFNITSHGIALLIMMPTTFFAGMTLPLITLALLNNGYGEKSVGTVYAFNTVGAIIGVALAVHIGMPWLGLKGLLGFGASIDLLLGLILLWRLPFKQKPYILKVSATVASVAVVTLTLLFIEFDLHKMSSGIYQNRRLKNPDESMVAYHHDGKTATVSILDYGDTQSILTNGKPDAHLTKSLRDEPTSDEPTMILTAAIPLAMHSEAKTIANIGFGSGLTTQIALMAPWITRIDTIEIESAMIEAAKHFGDRVEYAMNDPRSYIHIDDARTYFSTYNKKYDIIISEPSNPWVSGVSSLFSEEFYSTINRHLNDNGIFVQWIPLYGMDIDLTISVLKALSDNFKDYVLYLTNDSNVMLVGLNSGSLQDPDDRIFEQPELKRHLARIGVMSTHDIALRKLGDKKVLDPLIFSFTVRANSVYYPVLDLGAAKASYLDTQALVLLQPAYASVPVMEMLSGQTPVTYRTTEQSGRFSIGATRAYRAQVLRDFFATGDFSRTRDRALNKLRRPANVVKFQLPNCNIKDRSLWIDSLFRVAKTVIPYSTPEYLEGLWGKLKLDRCEEDYDIIQKHWLDLFLAVSSRNAEAMATQVRSLLDIKQEIHPEHLNYALKAGILGYVRTGDHENATLLWKLYGHILPKKYRTSLVYKLLLGHADCADCVGASMS